MTEILESTDIDLTVLIDFESEAACDWGWIPGDPTCQNAAEYTLWFEPCRCRKVLLCTYHLRRQLEQSKVPNICGLCFNIVISIEYLPI